MEKQKDWELIQEFREGNEESFNLLFKEYHPAIFRFISRMIRDEAEAEDLTQEVFVRAYFKISSFEGRSSFKLWLFSIARNMCLDKFKKRRLFFFSLETPVKQGGDEQTLSDVIAADIPSPEQELISARQVKVIEGHLNSLAPEQKMALVLSCFEMLSYEEISQVMFCSLAKVKILIFRAKSKLKDMLQDKGN